MYNMHNKNGDCWGSEAKKRRIVCCLFYFRAGVSKCKQKDHNKRDREEYKEHQNMFKILLRMPRRNEKRHKAHKK